MGKRKWSKATVLEALRAWHDEGKTIAELRRLKPGLIVAAQRCFGSWNAARQAAGWPPLRREWTPQTVLAAIRERHARGLPLTMIKRDDRGLEAAARERFGSWPEAVRAAGLQPKRRRSWDRQRVLAALRDWQAQGLPMTKVSQADPGLYLAAVRHLGSWHAAMVALALPWSPPRKWSRAQILEGLRAWHRLPKIALSVYDCGLAGAVRTHFGSLNAALLAAGLEPRRRLWPRQRVLEAIQDGHIRGLKASCPGFGNQALAAAAQRRFGSWRAAVLAAGLQPRKPMLSWTPERVLAEIRRWPAKGRSLTRVWAEYPELVSAAHRCFGTWHQAIRAAGLTPPKNKRCPSGTANG